MRCNKHMLQLILKKSCWFKFSIYELHNLCDVMWHNLTRLPTYLKGIKPNVIHINNFNWSKRTSTWLVIKALVFGLKKRITKAQTYFFKGYILVKEYSFITFETSPLSCFLKIFNCFISLHFSIFLFFYLFIYFLHCTSLHFFTFFFCSLLIDFTSLYFFFLPSLYSTSCL